MSASTLIDKQTHELAVGDVVAVWPEPKPVADGLLEHRWANTRPPSLRSGRWLAVTQVLAIDDQHVRVYFGEGNFAVAPLHGCAWYVQAQPSFPADERTAT